MNAPKHNTHKWHVRRVTLLNTFCLIGGHNGENDLSRIQHTPETKISFHNNNKIGNNNNDNKQVTAQYAGGWPFFEQKTLRPCC